MAQQSTYQSKCLPYWNGYFVSSRVGSRRLNLFVQSGKNISTFCFVPVTADTRAYAILGRRINHLRTHQTNKIHQIKILTCINPKCPYHPAFEMYECICRVFRKVRTEYFENRFVQWCWNRQGTGSANLAIRAIHKNNWIMEASGSETLYWFSRKANLLCSLVVTSTPLAQGL